MVIVLLAANAWAGAFTGEVDGKPFAPTAVIAAPDPNHPGLMTLVAAKEKVSCGDIGKQKKPKGTMLVFNADPATGVVQGGLYAGDQLFVVLTGGGKLGDLPAVGKTGTVDLSLTGAGVAANATGTLTYTLCAAIPPAPPLTVDLEAADVTLEDGLKARFSAPKGWASSQNEYTKSMDWTGPDGFTSLSLGTTCNGGCEASGFREQSTKWLDEVTSGFVGQPGWTVDVLEKAEVEPGTWVVRWRAAQAAGTTEFLDVMRWEEGWQRIVHCQASTQPHRAALLDGLRSACVGVELVP
jgi:hypothetical protein